MNYKELVDYMVKALVENPDQYSQITSLDNTYQS